MSNGQTTGAALGEALAASTNTLLSFYLRKRQLTLQEQGLAQRTINDERQIALGALRILGEFATPGTTVAENAFLIGPAEALLDTDGVNSFKDAIVNSQGGGVSPLEALEVAFLNTLPEEGRLALGEASIAKKAGQEASTVEGVATGQVVERAQSPFVRAYAASLTNPNLSSQTALLRENTGREAFGFDKLFTVQLPDGRVVDITETAGNMNARFMQIRQGREQFNQADFAALAIGVKATIEAAGLSIDPIDARRIARAKLNGTMAELAANNEHLLPAIRVAAEASVGQLGNARLLLNQMGPRGAAVNIQMDQIRELHDAEIIDDEEFEEQMNVQYNQANNLSRLSGNGTILGTVETETILFGIRLGDPQFTSFNPAALQPNQIDVIVSAFVSGRLSEEQLLAFNLDETVIARAKAAKIARGTDTTTLFAPSTSE